MTISSIHLPAEPTAIVAQAERITNEAALEELVALYHPDAVADWIIDGAHQHLDGLPAIEVAATALTGMWRAQQFKIRKTLQCADDTTVALTWRGGFGEADNQIGSEFWTFREGLVVRHQIHGFLDVRPADCRIAQTRVFINSPRFAISMLSHQRRARRTHQPPGTQGASAGTRLA